MARGMETMGRSEVFLGEGEEGRQGYYQKQGAIKNCSLEICHRSPFSASFYMPKLGIRAAPAVRHRGELDQRMRINSFTKLYSRNLRRGKTRTARSYARLRLVKRIKCLFYEKAVNRRKHLGKEAVWYILCC